MTFKVVDYTIPVPVWRTHCPDMVLVLRHPVRLLLQAVLPVGPEVEHQPVVAVVVVVQGQVQLRVQHSPSSGQRFLHWFSLVNVSLLLNISAVSHIPSSVPCPGSVLGSEPCPLSLDPFLGSELCPWSGALSLALSPVPGLDSVPWFRLRHLVWLRPWFRLRYSVWLRP